MIRVTVEVGSGGARSAVAVQAENIRHAVQIVEDQNPGSESRVSFPIDPDTFFIGGTTTGAVEREEAA